jgi:2-polyprenyl-6-methoxyphenol hydroxylase-like FAD-dependent oxidoreductase
MCGLPFGALGATMPDPSERAVVIGASMGGLLAAHALADTFGEVVLLERDQLPSDIAHRKGVPQSRHAHILLSRGREILEELFPGLTQDLVEQGAPLARSDQVRRFIGGGYYCRFGSQLRNLLVSRPLLEAQVRSRVLAHSQVRAIGGADVVGLVASRDRRRVDGVRLAYRRPDGGRSAEETLEAALVVDATGRGSRSPAWLGAMGYAPPEEERIEVGVGYASRHYRREPHHLGGDLSALVAPTPACRRAAVVAAQEGGRWVVTVVGFHGDHPRTDSDGFVGFAQGLAVPDVHELVSRAEPLDDPVPASFPANLRRRYERLSRFPDGLLVFGDAICCFNPMYGQGMTVAALQALALCECLASGTGGLAPRFFQRAARAVDTPWTLAAGNDQRLLRSGAPRSSVAARLLEWYVGRLHVAARRDPVAALAFVRVTGLIDPPEAMLRPRVAAHVLWGNLRRDPVEPSCN